jgi:hypothetical protein
LVGDAFTGADSGRVDGADVEGFGGCRGGRVFAGTGCPDKPDVDVEADRGADERRQHNERWNRGAGAGEDHAEGCPG